MAVRFLSSENIDGVLTFSTTGTFGNNASITHYTNNYLYIRGGSAGLVVGDNTSATRALFSSSNFITWEINSGAAMHMDSSKRLGIGTSSPNHRLDIYSNENIPLRIHRPSNSNLNSAGAHGIGFSTRSDAITSTTDTRSGIFSYYNGNLFFATNTSNIESDPDGSARMTILNTGYVGIGTMTPSKLLVLYGSTPFIRLEDDQGGSKRLDLWVDNSAVAHIDANQSASQITFRTASTDRLRIANNGNVGIGTITPDGKLEVAGGTTLGLRITNAGDSSAYDQTRITYSGYNSGSPEMVFMPLTTPGSGVLNTFFRFRNTNGTSTAANNTANVSVDGSVGIGIDSPSTKLEIQVSTNQNILRGHFGQSADIFLGFDQTNPRLILQDNSNVTTHLFQANASNYIVNSNVGIGVTNPSFKTHFRGGSNTEETVLKLDKSSYADTGGHTTILGFGNEPAGWAKGGIGYERTASYDRGKIHFLQENTGNTDTVTLADSVMTIQPDGSVGIGTTSPGALLEINGVDDSGATDLLRLEFDNSPADTGITFTNLFGAVKNRITMESNNTDKLMISAAHSIEFSTNTTSSNTNQRLTISNGGNVHIVNGRLDLSDGSVYDSSVNAGSTLYLNCDADNNSTGEKVVIGHGAYGTGSTAIAVFQENGNVGINLSSPAAVLDIYSPYDVTANPDSTGIRLRRVSGGSQSYLLGMGVSGISNDYFAIRDITNSAYRFVITNGGNVGIGTTSPSYKLEVNGGTALVGGGFYVSSDQSIVTSSTYTFRDGVYINNPNSTSAATTSNSVMSIGAMSGNSVSTSLITTGAVGIGTTSPTAKLTIDNGSTAGGSLLKSSSSSYTAHFIANTGSGNAGIYCDASNGDFIGSDYVFFGQHDDKWAQISSGPSASGIRFMPADSIRMVINNSGNVGIGTTSPSTLLQVHGQQKWYTTNADGNELRGFFNPGGAADDAELYLYKADGATQGVAWRGEGDSYIRVDSTSLQFINFYYGTTDVGQIVTGGTNVLYQSNSDYRLKENVVEMTGALDRVNQLKPSRFNFISHPDNTVDGFMAHELQEVVPQAVTGEKDATKEDGTPKYQGVDHSQIVPLLVGAIKELKAEIENLKSQIQ